MNASRIVGRTTSVSALHIIREQWFPVNAFRILESNICVCAVIFSECFPDRGVNKREYFWGRRANCKPWFPVNVLHVLDKWSEMQSEPHSRAVFKSLCYTTRNGINNSRKQSEGIIKWFLFITISIRDIQRNGDKVQPPLQSVLFSTNDLQFLCGYTIKRLKRTERDEGMGLCLLLKS